MPAKKKIPNFITSYSGNIIHVLDPKPEEIHMDDIAHGLSNLCRYGGQCIKFYCVAQHCVIVAMLLRPKNGEDTVESINRQLKGLLHDASEGLGLADIPAPVKHSGRLEGYIELEDKMQNTVYARFGLEPGDDPDVKTVDKLVLMQEQYCLRNRGDEKPFPFDIKPWTPKRAKAEFLKLAEKLLNDRDRATSNTGSET